MIRILKYSLLSLLFFLRTGISLAQYESIRDPLSSEDKEMAQRYHIKTMRLYAVKNHNESLVHFVEYTPLGKLKQTISEGVRYFYNYDSKGNTVKMTDSFRDDKTGSLTRDTFEFTYDQNGFLKHAKLNDNESVFIYDSASSTLVEQKKDTSWPERIINSYTYNAHHGIIEMHIQDPARGVMTTEKITYFPDHQIKQDVTAILSRDGSMDSTITDYVYNFRGKKVQETTRSISYTNGKLSFSRYTNRQEFYDNDMRLLEEFFYEDGTEKERYVYSYSGAGPEPVVIAFFSKGVLMRTDNFELDPKTGLPATLTETENGATSTFRYEFELYRN